jgi:hypothetical protein
MELDNTADKILVPAATQRLAAVLLDMLGGAPGQTAAVPVVPVPTPPPAPESPIEKIKVQIHPDGRMDPKNAALYLGKKEKTLAQWRSQGKGPRFVRVGGHIFYFQRDLDAAIR